MAVCTQIQEGRLVHAFGHSVLIGSLWSPMHTVLFPHGGVGYVCSLFGWEYLLTAETLGRSHREEFSSA